MQSSNPSQITVTWVLEVPVNCNLRRDVFYITYLLRGRFTEVPRSILFVHKQTSRELKKLCLIIKPLLYSGQQTQTRF